MHTYTYIHTHIHTHTRVQGIIPTSAMSSVLDLFVAEKDLPQAKREAEILPKLNISKLDCQWLQVS